MNVKANTVIQWVDANCPALSWRILAMKQMKFLMSHKVFPARIDDSTLFNEEIMKVMKEAIKKDYGKELPDFK